MRDALNERVMIVFGVVGTALLMLSGCAGCQREPRSSTEATSPPAAGVPGSSLDPSEQAAVDEVLRIYETYLRVTADASSTGEDRTEELKKLLADPLRTQVLLDLQQQQKKGMMYAGELKSNPKVTAIRLHDDPPTAAIEDCLDRSSYRLVYRANGSPVPVPSGNLRYVGTVTATRYPGQGWLLSRGEIVAGATC